MITIDDVSYGYEGSGREALSHITLTIERGEFLAVVGHNGSGKSTLAKHLNGLLLPASGTVAVSGLDTRDERNTLAIRQKVGMVFQNPDNQLVTTVVEEDVAFGPENLGIPPEHIRERVDEALLGVKMSEHAQSAPHMLSGGQKQRIAIAGMLAMRPEVLVLDEATAMLDPKGRRDVLDIVHRLNRTQGMTVVMITQYMEEALDADRVAVMAGGRIVALDTPRRVFMDAGTLREHGLDVPELLQLRDALIASGVSLDPGLLDVSELAGALIPIMKAGSGKSICQ